MFNPRVRGPGPYGPRGHFNNAGARPFRGPRPPPFRGPPSPFDNRFPFRPRGGNPFAGGDRRFPSPRNRPYIRGPRQPFRGTKRDRGIGTINTGQGSSQRQHKPDAASSANQYDMDLHTDIQLNNQPMEEQKEQHTMGEGCQDEDLRHDQDLKFTERPGSNHKQNYVHSEKNKEAKFEKQDKSRSTDKNMDSNLNSEELISSVREDSNLQQEDLTVKEEQEDTQYPTEEEEESLLQEESVQSEVTETGCIDVTYDDTPPLNQNSSQPKERNDDQKCSTAKDKGITSLRDDGMMDDYARVKKLFRKWETIKAMPPALPPRSLEDTRGPLPYRCDLCNLGCNSKSSYLTHLGGTKHLETVKLQKEGQLGRRPESNVNQKAVLQIENADDCLDKSLFHFLSQSLTLPLLGLDHITEFLKVDPTHLNGFDCDLCGVRADGNSIIYHVIGLYHRLRYLYRHKPDKFAKFEKEFKHGEHHAAKRALDELCEDVFKTDGAGQLKMMREKKVDHNGKEVKVRVTPNMKMTTEKRIQEVRKQLLMSLPESFSTAPGPSQTCGKEEEQAYEQPDRHQQDDMYQQYGRQEGRRKRQDQDEEILPRKKPRTSIEYPEVRRPPEPYAKERLPASRSIREPPSQPVRESTHQERDRDRDADRDRDRDRDGDWNRDRDRDADRDRDRNRDADRDRDRDRDADRDRDRDADRDKDRDRDGDWNRDRDRDADRDRDRNRDADRDRDRDRDADRDRDRDADRDRDRDAVRDRDGDWDRDRDGDWDRDGDRDAVRDRDAYLYNRKYREQYPEKQDPYHYERPQRERDRLSSRDLPERGEHERRYLERDQYLDQYRGRDPYARRYFDLDPARLNIEERRHILDRERYLDVDRARLEARGVFDDGRLMENYIAMRRARLLSEEPSSVSIATVTTATLRSASVSCPPAVSAVETLATDNDVSQKLSQLDTNTLRQLLATLEGKSQVSGPAPSTREPHPEDGYMYDRGNYAQFPVPIPSQSAQISNQSSQVQGAELISQMVSGLIQSDDDAEAALKVSNSLSQALLTYRMKHIEQAPGQTPTYDYPSSVPRGVGPVEAPTYPSSVPRGVGPVVAPIYQSSVPRGVGPVVAPTYQSSVPRGVGPVVAPTYQSSVPRGVGPVVAPTYQSSVPRGVGPVVPSTYQSSVPRGVGPVVAPTYPSDIQSAAVTWTSQTLASKNIKSDPKSSINAKLMLLDAAPTLPAIPGLDMAPGVPLATTQTSTLFSSKNKLKSKESTSGDKTQSDILSAIREQTKAIQKSLLASYRQSTGTTIATSNVGVSSIQGISTPSTLASVGISTFSGSSFPEFGTNPYMASYSAAGVSPVVPSVSTVDNQYLTYYQQAMQSGVPPDNVHGHNAAQPQYPGHNTAPAQYPGSPFSMTANTTHSSQPEVSHVPNTYESWQGFYGHNPPLPPTEPPRAPPPPPPQR